MDFNKIKENVQVAILNNTLDMVAFTPYHIHITNVFINLRDGWASADAYFRHNNTKEIQGDKMKFRVSIPAYGVEQL